MTEHSIDELVRQLQAAKERRRQADEAVRAAEIRLQDAVNKASGLIGHSLAMTITRNHYRGTSTIIYRILVDRVPRNEGTACGRNIRRDGTLGNVVRTLKISESVDEGPWTQLTSGDSGK